MLRSEPLYYLDELARCHSFRIASENLHITQPALSIAIKKLEAELGVTLLERTTKSVRLTEVGEAVVQLSREVIERLEVIEHIKERQNEDVDYDHLQIYTFPAISQGVLDKVLSYLCPANELNKLVIKDVHIQEIMALILSDSHAFALAWHLRGQQTPAGEEIGAHKLYSAKAQLMMAKDCSLLPLSAESITLKEVMTLPLVSYGGGYGINDLLFELLIQRYGVPENMIEVPNMTLFDQMIQSGNAVAFGVDLTGWKCIDKSNTHRKKRFVPLKENIVFDFVVYYNLQCPQTLREHVIAVFEEAL